MKEEERNIVETPSDAQRKAPSCVDNRVTVDLRDSIGAIFLGMANLVLLIFYLRSEARNRELMEQLQQRR